MTEYLGKMPGYLSKHDIFVSSLLGHQKRKKNRYFHGFRTKTNGNNPNNQTPNTNAAPLKDPIDEYTFQQDDDRKAAVPSAAEIPRWKPRPCRGKIHRTEAAARGDNVGGAALFKEEKKLSKQLGAQKPVGLRNVKDDWVPSREGSHIPPWEKENHLQNAIFGGYVSSLVGSGFKYFSCSTRNLGKMNPF